jgi:cytochrome c-type biogenesis protein CcmF
MSRWKQDGLGRIMKPLIASAVVAIVLGVAISAALGAWNARAITGWIGGLWLIFGTFSYLRTALRGRRRGLPRHQIGMIMAHAGIGVFVIGVAMVSSSTIQRDVRVEPGQTVEMEGYRFELHEVASVKGSNWIADEARFTVYKGDDKLYDMAPQKRRYHRSGQVMTQVALRPGFTRDLYIAMGEELDSSSGAWSIRIHIKPFVRWIWAGALLLALGGLVSASDRRYWRERRVEARRETPSGAAGTGDEVPA